MESNQHANHMQEFLLKMCTSDQSVIIGPERYRKIVDVLLGLKTPTPSFKFWLKKNDFQIIDIPSTNETNILVGPRKSVSTQDEVGYVRVLKFEDIYPAVWEIHVNEQNHGGSKKCFESALKLYYRLPRSYIEEFVRTCLMCSQKKKKYEDKLPIVAESAARKCVLDKIKINTVDMRNVSTGGYTHLGMVEDQFSKFVVLFPLKTNTPADVAQAFNHYFLGIFGPPKVFLSDNGHEFMDNVLHELLHMWNGIPLTLVNETPSTLSPQDGSDRCSIVFDTLTTLILERGDNSCAWHDWLPDIALRLNTTENEFRRSPYRMMFGHNSHGGEYESNVIIRPVESADKALQCKTENAEYRSACNDVIDDACDTAITVETTDIDAVESSKASFVEKRGTKRKNEQKIEKSSGESLSKKLEESLLPLINSAKINSAKINSAKINSDKTKKKKTKKRKQLSLAGCKDMVVVKATSTSAIKALDRSKLGVIESSSPIVRRSKPNSKKVVYMESEDESDNSLESSEESESEEEEDDVDVLNFINKGIGEKAKMKILKTIVTSLTASQKKKKKKKKGKP